MPIVIGDTTITGLNAGGLPDGTVTASDLASSLNLTSKGFSLPNKVYQAPARTVIGNGNYSAGTWYELSTNNQVTSGTYVLGIYYTTHNAGGGTYDVFMSTVPFYIRNSGTNGTNGTETQNLPFAYGTGHAPNDYPNIKLQCNYNVNGGQYQIMWTPTTSISGINNTYGRTANFYFMRIGD